jgi:hypothetical protein
VDNTAAATWKLADSIGKVSADVASLDLGRPFSVTVLVRTGDPADTLHVVVVESAVVGEGRGAEGLLTRLQV